VGTLYVETLVAARLDEVWERTTDPDQHVRWDLRFSEITPQGADGQGREAFTYRLDLPGRQLTGCGVSVGERRRDDGTRTSALRFAADDRLSPLAAGSGYWRFVPVPGGVRFLTGYSYEPGWGRVGALVDRPVLQPFLGWLTARSFDALRIWLEHGLPPERAHQRGAVDLALRGAAVAVAGQAVRRRHRFVRLVAAASAGALVSALPAPDTVPRARRCLRRPPDRVSGRPPGSLARLAPP
jgi:hypothetical protein